MGFDGHVLRWEIKNFTLGEVIRISHNVIRFLAECMLCDFLFYLITSLFLY